MKNRKIIFIFITVLCLSICLCGCQKDTNSESPNVTKDTTKQQNEHTVSTSAETEASETTVRQRTEADVNTLLDDTLAAVNVDTPNDVLNEYKELAISISEQYEDPNMLFSINMRNGQCYLAFYHGDTLNCITVESGCLVRIEDNLGGSEPYMTAETISQLPVLICENSLGYASLEDAYNYNEQSEEVFDSEVKDGIYYGTILGINEDGTQALVSMGVPYLDENGEVYYEGGEGTYYYTGERFFQIVSLSDNVTIVDYFKLKTANESDYETEGALMDFLTYTVISDEVPSIFSAPFMNYCPLYAGIYSEKGAYDGWTSVYCQASPITIENGVVTNITINPSTEYCER